MRRLQNLLHIPFAIYANFEAITKNVCREKKYDVIKKYKKHIAGGYGYIAVPSSDDKTNYLQANI